MTRVGPGPLDLSEDGRHSSEPPDNTDVIHVRPNRGRCLLVEDDALLRRFVGRVDYTRATAFLNDERNGEYRSITAGLSFFF